ncbi:cob(I)yrinic acid a,c-diamide adenosyltransferase [Clostridium sp. DSM 8431]|uniref:cob(I)yrinic acid a,c-diamide adenosyltransferase n=1 Tax=Clostridium sp. DSM 8431 TaxID=1761781 RepID=UPI0008E7BB6D|nr:cob(I)yrinic acid a,c-diamide adenosyltransferase [Clostridium sp. DSM 8431]SFU42355.1 cob(I)yrinic acid a,c-diamide adenosyltransferase [Clostridium sp. DSM 8431]
MKDKLGLIHIYTGDGKGKTTSSVGLAVRALGAGLNVVFCQFLKSGTSSELNILKDLDNLILVQGEGVKGFVKYMSEEEVKHVTKMHDEMLLKCISLCKEGKCDMLILDEIMAAVNLNVVSYDVLLDFLRNKPENVEIVMTGRNPKEELIDLADYVSEIRKIKHPFDEGINARYGVEK